MTTSQPKFYDAPEDYLQQGDIFRLSVVCPAADEKPRILRAKDGRHGSVVFEENCAATVFDLGSLRSLLSSLASRTDMHTAPFALTRDGQGEMVVVYARLFRYFVIASHTCDVSGMDKDALQWTIILPIITLAETCKSSCLPLKSEKEATTIEHFLTTHSSRTPGLADLPEEDYAEAAKEATVQLIESGRLLGKALEDAKQVKKFLNQYSKKKIMYSLRGAKGFGLPESYIDFSAAFIVPTSKLEGIKGFRIVRISEPYRSDFSRRLADIFSRSTLPEPMEPPPIP